MVFCYAISRASSLHMKSSRSTSLQVVIRSMANSFKMSSVSIGKLLYNFI